jgi:putative membrane-bound dehydrogenase-like protein
MNIKTSVLSLIGIVVLFTSTPIDAQAQDKATLLSIPQSWRKEPKGALTPQDGYSWYRCLVQVPADWKDADLTLYVEALDDARATFFNGQFVGATGTFPPRFRSGLGEKGKYAVDAKLVRPGAFNTVAIRVYQNDPRPNFSVAPPVLLNAKSKQGLRMSGKWQYFNRDDRAFATATAKDFSLDPAKPVRTGDDLGAFATIDEVKDVATYVRKRVGDRDPYSPLDAEKLFEHPGDLEVQLVLGDPDISQPLFMNWDERGRLWVLEYRQYPHPAGLKVVSRDVYLRAVYDKVPKAPPHHEKGLDRISVHEDTNGDGVYDKHKVVIDGLSIATSFARGRGGLFVTNPPYLLFYPDKNGDDIPDGDPEVLLEGFGMEDTHSVINSLRFGPDGWLYGAQGSTVSANIKKPGTKDKPIRSMGQQIWRYHPEKRIYETFAEGGGNTFGVEIDEKGRIYSGHNGGNTRGFHYVQGGYYRKGFGKHGPLSNPYAFGFFANMKHHSVPRFTHNFIIYEGNVLPSHYRGRLFGIEPLQGQLVMSDFQPHQSSFETRDISRVIKTDDQWFRPVDIKAGPDGSIYFADLYEQRIDHSSHHAGRVDKTTGRIYRLRPSELKKNEPFDYGKLDNKGLVKLLAHPNKWHRQTALRLIGNRREKSLIPVLKKQALEAGGQLALETLWALHLSGGLTDDNAIELLGHGDQHVRAWTVRLLCDHYKIQPDVAAALTRMAGNEPYITARKQLASSAKRLPADQALPIIRNLLKYDEDVGDIHQPLLLWWAIESKAGSDADKILKQLFADKNAWQQALVKQVIVERLIKRFAQSGTRADLDAAAEFLNSAPDKASTETLLKGFEEAFKGRSLVGIPDKLVDALAATGGGSTALRLRQGQPAAIKATIDAVMAGKDKERGQYVRIFGELGKPEFIPALLSVVEKENDVEVVSAALTALQAFDDLRVGQTVVQNFGRLPKSSRVVAETMLFSRSVWAIEFLQAVDKGNLKTTDVSETGLRKALLHKDARIESLIDKHWGTIAGATTEQMQKRIAELKTVLSGGSGNPKKGKLVYKNICGKCHVLHGEGGKIGPDLTSFKRDNEDRILINIVNPSIEIREGFENYVLITEDGRIANGFLADKDNQVVVLRGIDGQNLIFRKDEIDEMLAIPRSVMPERTLKDLSVTQIRDLFAYLRSSQPVNY